jgi:FAD/FMN-containing dehydrogenase
MMKIRSWGRLTDDDHHCINVTADHLEMHVATSGFGLPFGAGKSYGDVCLNPGSNLWITSQMDRIVDFDPSRQRITCEAGLLLRDLQDLTSRHGLLLPVSPGTQLLTVGGAIANDIHGKSHHQFGSFGHHVASLTLFRSDTGRIRCSPTEEPELFAATIGGLGLTGLIIEAELELRPVPGLYLTTHTEPFDSLDEFFQLSLERHAEMENTVAWIDCTHTRGHRGLFISGNFTADTPPNPKRSLPEIGVPKSVPLSLANRATIKPLNALYYALGRRNKSKRFQHYRTFFYPLDSLRNWNRLYGPRGFYQYQSVVPPVDQAAVTGAMLTEIARSHQGSFLAVLKTFGTMSNVGYLSFPMPGTTLALDFPNRGKATLDLFNRLDQIVEEAGGRLYPAKDARMSGDFFIRSFPGYEHFRKHRDPQITSAFAERVMGAVQ